MNFVLGISCFFHDSAAALVSDQEIICAADEERFTRVKHDSRFPVNAIKFCLSNSNININDIDALVFHEDPAVKFDRVSKSFIKNLPKSLTIAKDIISSWHNEKLWLKETAIRELKIPSTKIHFSEHHFSHSSSAYYPSGFKEAATLTLDGVGEWITSQGGLQSDKDFKKSWHINFPHSLGLLYSSFAEFLGFEVNEGEFKVMGMAPYGSPKYIDKIEKLFIKRNSVSYEMDMDFFTYEYSNKSNLGKKFYNLFGDPRKKESPFLSDSKKNLILENQVYFADIASSLQNVIEDQIVNMAKNLRVSTKSDNLCYAGGVAYNSVANGKIINESGFKNVWIQPAAGDNGAALGAALAFQASKNSNNKYSMQTASLGKSYNEKECINVLEKVGLNYKILNEKEIIELTAEQISQGKIIAWFDGRFEFGPRALGNRSILADPRYIETKNKVNLSVKYREIFRPFAPMVTKESASNFFEFGKNTVNQQPFKFMLAVTKVKENFRDKLQAITHVDGTARVQIVDEINSNKVHKLLKAFESKTNFPILLNTSFNKRGEPMVASPGDAIQTFMWSDLDILVLNNIFIKK